MKKIPAWIRTVSVVTGLVTASSASATTGYFALGYGAKAMGLGGAVVSNPQDTATIAVNPAGITAIGERVDVGLATELLRTQETLRLALADRPVPTGVCAGLNEIGFGAFEGGSLERYRTWAWRSAPDAPCPGGGESRAAVALRLATSLERLLERPETAVLAVSHALPVRYVLDAAAGRVPRRRVEPVAHVVPLVLSSDEVARAAAILAGWSRAPRFRDGDDA